MTVDEGKPFDVVFLDFAKAFDKVPKKRLLKKLYKAWYTRPAVEVD